MAFGMPDVGKELQKFESKLDRLIELLEKLVEIEEGKQQ